MIMPLDEYHGTFLRVKQHWFRYIAWCRQAKSHHIDGNKPSPEPYWRKYWMPYGVNWRNVLIRLSQWWHYGLGMLSDFLAICEGNIPIIADYYRSQKTTNSALEYLLCCLAEEALKLISWVASGLRRHGPRVISPFPDDIFRTIFFMKIHEFRLNFHWSLFRGVQLTIFQYWFR